MSEALGLIGLTRAGALLTVLLACAVVWMTMTMRQLRSDVKANADGIRSNAEAIAALTGEVHRIARDVAVLRDRDDLARRASP